MTTAAFGENFLRTYETDCPFIIIYSTIPGFFNNPTAKSFNGTLFTFVKPALLNKVSIAA